jgi:hypothetical protein
MMAQVIALTAPAALGLSGASFHEPFHADGGKWAIAVTERSEQNPPQRRHAWRICAAHPDDSFQPPAVRTMSAHHDHDPGTSGTRRCLGIDGG